MKNTFNIHEVSNLLDVSIPKLLLWEKKNKLVPTEKDTNGINIYLKNQLVDFPIAKDVFESKWDEEIKIKPLGSYNSIELFAGAGGMALGFEKAGIHHVLLNEIDKFSCSTLRKNRPEWNVIEDDIKNLDFKKYANKVEIVTGGFPCQSFSAAGKKLGFEDTRGTLFFEFARCIKEVQPKIFVGENVKGLFHHDKGRTLQVIKDTIHELGYTLIEPRVLKAMYYKVPQKRERLFLIGIRNDLAEKNNDFKFPAPYKKVLTLTDAFKKGDLFDNDVPESIGDMYPARKKEILDFVPQGGYWKDLPDDLQREFMQRSYFLGGGKTGLARRLSMTAPSLTLVCSPSMKQTERCHPLETRPLTIRESARIQTFPDEWEFVGPKSQAYKQIGNAVPVNLAWSVARSIIDYLNKINVDNRKNTKTILQSESV
ncbi:DNA cytosine methyltransferase [Flavobacterium degerlachei]|uniref:Cytosine-specific methyltransferase n=1 Tax=Flavobacterium degerlachei TaxID=229203 RepID=A0A1H3GLQ3_9FLAO|nr:DNA (cytosine-5-)-methyltransferase [Flavobacterium degerlachei]SDY03925.1 DNA (cytosine-5)-methyltransferase 1 [Flavobacterium degerlachei]